MFIAVVAISFMGCPTVYKDRDYDCLPVGDLMGDMNNADGVPLVENAGVEGGYKTASFTYSKSMSEWGGGNGTLNFKIRAVAGDWSVSYGRNAVEAAVLPDGVTLLDEGDNITLKGLVDGQAYHFEFVTIAPKIKISLIED